MTFWLVLHVLAAIAGVGPEIAFGMMGPRARRRGRVEAHAVYGAIAAARARVVYPALLLQVVSGTVLIAIGPFHAFRDPWLGVSLALYAIAVGLVALVLVPGSRRARAALADGMEPGDPGLRPLWTRQAAVAGVAGTLLVAVAVLMVWKPG
jgi:hypothetical protein